MVRYSAALAAAARIGLELPLPQGAGSVPEPERWIKTICLHCDAGCAVFIGVSGDRVVASMGSCDDRCGRHPCIGGMAAMMKNPDIELTKSRK